MPIGYKLLTKDLQSLSTLYPRVQYGPEWITVPGNGAYLAITLQGLLLGGIGPVLAELEFKDDTPIVGEDVVTARRVRILRHAPLTTWHFVRVALGAARRMTNVTDDSDIKKCVAAIESCERLRTSEAVTAMRVAREAIIPLLGAEARPVLMAARTVSAAARVVEAAVVVGEPGAFWITWEAETVIRRAAAAEGDEKAELKIHRAACSAKALAALTHEVFEEASHPVGALKN